MFLIVQINEGTVLGTMETPVSLMLGTKKVLLCCSACVKQAKANPDATLARVEQLMKHNLTSKKSAPARTPQEQKIQDNLARLSAEDRQAAELQQLCPVNDDVRLGAMGVPQKVVVKGKVIFTCCKSCNSDVQAHPDMMIKKVEEFKARKAKDR